MRDKNQRTPCLVHGPRPLTAPEAVVIVIVLVLSVTLVMAGMPSLAVFVLMGEACSLGARLVRRLRRSLQPVPAAVQS
ncbi:hypothetical protein E4N62_18905 [Streptomyces sp. MNU76]|uniref:hypothetical protein n=1 Tax=Streptomyces sp. MNU76 TaxID=2560026 RepID=UPI001E5EE38B|nr:hypothetical protein [Streptomyces sp. MNU76]MCC9707159.1 hypothetical protein [Streptomyces sp. MNU76]